MLRLTWPNTSRSSAPDSVAMRPSRLDVGALSPRRRVIENKHSTEIEA